MSRFIELYSGNRNRNQYPLASSFEVPFSSTLQNATPDKSLDPIIDGSIYFSFTLSPPTIPAYTGNFAAGSSTSSPILDVKQAPGYSYVNNFFVGYTIVDITSGESRVVRSYSPSTSSITLDSPFSAITAGDPYELYSGFPTKTSLFLPGVDNNNNPILDYELAYNGYYVVFESPNSNYSNADNSNIFYRKISYYDNINRIAYFDEPLTFDYKFVVTSQQFTLRQSLPSERWTLSTATFYNTLPPVDPLIGPLVGYVITLPPGASSVDNFYRGKYVYFASNAPETYAPPYPDPYILDAPLPGLFYPVYGTYYIKAYNGTTRQLSIILSSSCSSPTYKNLPTYLSLGYDSSAFGPPASGNNTGITSISNVGGTTYRADLESPVIVQYTMFVAGPVKFKPGLTYTISINIRKSPDIQANSVTMLVFGAYNYKSSFLTNVYQTFTFQWTPIDENFNLYLNFIDAVFVGPSPYIEWDAFSMIETDTINITSFSRDNFSPLSYNGSIVSQNQTVCCEVSLISMTLPNLPLSAGSRIAFYPFVYVEFVNATSPSGASSQIIYSNNPKSNKALFMAAVGAVSNPGQQTFVNLTGAGMTQTIKFKPNDNLRFSVYLPDGSPFEPLALEILSPYPPDSRSQIDAIFSFRRIEQQGNSNFTIL
jgi:hypothetical protein